MLGYLTRQPADLDPSVLIPWLQRSLLDDSNTFETAIRVKLRGNILHVVCESARAGLACEVVVARLVRSLLQTPSITTRLESDSSQVYQVYLYAREASAVKPVWSAPIYLTRLDRHLEWIRQWESHLPVSTLASRGNLDAITQYLEEALGALSIGVNVSARILPGKASDLEADKLTFARDEESHRQTSQVIASRLWILCEVSYSPDPLVIAEPISQRLRQLQLKQFQDAAITIQVTGEAASDWRLRVDLTPPEEMLRRWGRWGDVPALSCLVNQISRTYGLKLIAEVKKDTLHLISYSINSAVVNSTNGATTSPLIPLTKEARPQIKIEELVAAIDSRLQAIAPQGLQRAVLYGPSTDDISPEWLKRIDLPAINRLELRKTASALATTGNIEALSYCLTRALNPDIREQLATGGIRVQVLEKGRLLHVMADGPICPSRDITVPLIKQLLEQIQPPDLDGIRLYGRRAGQKQPIWSYSHDYKPRERQARESTAEFAASDAYTGELITSVSDRSLADEIATVDDTDIRLCSAIKRTLQRMLLKSQVFISLDEGDNSLGKRPKAFRSDISKMTLFWGAVGVFLAIQFDFIVGQALQQRAIAPSPTTEETIDTNQPLTNQFNDELSQLHWKRDQATDRQWNLPADDRRSEGFLSSSLLDDGDITSSAVDDNELLHSPQQSVIDREVLLAGPELPSFRSQQLNEKLALYRRRVEQSGVPDVLVIGSSRALRGIDPAALREALANSGYKNLSVFNFGVNGATAQVVDLVVRRLIAPNQLPQVIIWADGARAFNSGRTDITFNAIAVSEGYRQLEASDPINGVEGLALSSLADQLALRATQTDQELSQSVGQMSSIYGDRDKVRLAIGHGLGAVLPREGFTWARPSSVLLELPDEDSDANEWVLAKEASLINYDGFLPLPNRFDPATYYQNHPRVAGDYDSDYEAFQLDGEQSDALTSLLRFTTDKEIPVVFVNTPLTDEYLDNYRAQAEDIFIQYMLQVAGHYSIFTFRDLGQLWPEQYDYFSDPSHLNRYGAYKISQRLSRDPLIPWPQTF